MTLYGPFKRMCVHACYYSSNSMKEKNPHVFAVIKPHAPSLVVLFILTLAGNAISLYIPKLIAQGIDTYSEGGFDIYAFSLQFLSS